MGGSAGLGASAGLDVELNENGGGFSAGLGAEVAGALKENGVGVDEEEAAGVEPNGFLGASGTTGLVEPNYSSASVIDQTTKKKSAYEGWCRIATVGGRSL